MNQITSSAILLAAILLFSGCETTSPTIGGNIDPKVRNAIALCSGGIDSSTGVKLEGAILANGGKIDVALQNKITGIFASKPGVTEANAVASQKLYTDCIDKRLNSDKMSSIDACQAKLTCEIGEMEALCRCTKTVTSIIAEKGYTENFKNKMLKEQCFAGQYDVQKCWGGEQISLARSSCEVLLTTNNRAIPKPDPLTSCSVKKS